MSRMHALVGISGKKRSGKDTAANYLIEHKGFTRVAFADPMREFLLAMDPIVEVEPTPEYEQDGLRVSAIVEMEGWEQAKAHPEVRRLLQQLGTEAGRKILGPDVWIEAANRKIRAIKGPVVITDVRFHNEAEAVRGAQGYLVRVDRPSLPVSTDEHTSETELDSYPFPLWLINDGSVADLHKDVATLSKLWN